MKFPSTQYAVAVMCTIALAVSTVSALPGTSGCTAYSPSTRVSYKDKTRVPACAILSYRPNGGAIVDSMYFPLYPKVDQFAMLTMNESTTFIQNILARPGAKPQDIQVQFEINGNVTRPVTWANGSGSRIPFWTVMISVNEGKFFTLGWDDSRGCKDCGDEECITERVSDGGGSECGEVSDLVAPLGQSSPATFLNCDDLPCPLKMYIVWLGTDAQGRPCESAGLRFSEMKKYSITSAIKAGRSSTFGSASGLSVSRVWVVAIAIIASILAAFF